MLVYFEGKTTLEGRNYASMIRDLHILKWSPAKISRPPLQTSSLECRNYDSIAHEPVTILEDLCAQRTQNKSVITPSFSQDSDTSEGRYCECTFGNAGPELETECYDAVTMRVYRQHAVDGAHVHDDTAAGCHARAIMPVDRHIRMSHEPSLLSHAPSP
ncbi:hypothetical protein K438DRAFT_1985204 [Mycena galopus ATCC 62051]|nr:hypothetical protein K438DRAFT_1985204 [Mycena galopus ATCC 62051]